MSSGTANPNPGTLVGSGRRTRGNSSNARFGRFLNNQPSSSFRNGQLTASALRRFRG